ncbi:MAG: OmpA family protein [Blastocatellia bacterium]|nr:OmpA family protein [Blastocatellia bacterium]
MEEDNALDFTFWPSFADLMLALVLILALVLFLVTAVIAAGTVNLSEVQKTQADMVNEIARSFDGKIINLDKDRFGISLTSETKPDLIILNEPTLQRITFSDNILFRPDDDRLNDRGVEVLMKVGQALKQQISHIREIQIQGHADTDSTKRYASNTHLAALRAIRVFKFLQEKVGINPAEYPMSATSFGEFKPVQRQDDGQYTEDNLREHNSTTEMKNRNRRIEMLLFYRVSEAARTR